MTAWEYLRSRDESELAALGREGWELVAVLPGEARGEATFYFKRPALGFRERVTLDQKRHYYNLMGIEVSAQDEVPKP
jgi:hypothetical protein